MTLEQLKEKYTLIMTYGDERRHGALEDFAPELIEALEKLQTKCTRKQEIIDNMCYLLYEDDETRLGTTLIDTIGKLKEENAEKLWMLKWCSRLCYDDLEWLVDQGDKDAIKLKELLKK